jgi:hypothetical protein
MDDLTFLTFAVNLPPDLFNDTAQVLDQTEMRIKFVSYRLPPFFTDSLIFDSPYLQLEVFDASVDAPLNL